MNISNKEHSELNVLVELALDGSISPEQSGRLNDLIVHNPAVCKYYCEYIHLTVGLGRQSVKIPATDLQEYAEVFNQELWEILAEEEKTAPAIELTEEEPKRELIQKVVYPPREKFKLTLYHKFTLAACAAMVLLMVYLNYAPQKPYSVEVATFVDQVNVQWADSGVSFANGDRLWSNQGPVVLEKGVIEIQYDDGVDVLVEGPANFRIERSGLYLEYGRLFSRVTESGLGFMVQTPTTRFVDQGTEFGVQADVNGSAQLHVIKGKVQLFAGSKGNAKTSQMITENQAARYDANTEKIEAVPVHTDAFVRKIDSASNVIWRGQKAIDLADIVNGGNGFGTGRKGFCIMPDTGRFTAVEETLLGSDPSGVTKLGSSYIRAVPALPAVDCVIVPGYGARAHLPLSTTGLSIPSFPELTGSLRWSIRTHLSRQEQPVTLNGMRYGVDGLPAILMHANCGITFDLDKIRQSIPGLEIASFKAICGIKKSASVGMYFDPENTADIRVFLDGREVFYQSVQHVENNAVPIEIDLAEGTARFMTLLVTCGTQSNDYDSCVFGTPELILEDR